MAWMSLLGLVDYMIMGVRGGPVRHCWSSRPFEGGALPMCKDLVLLMQQICL